MVEVGDIDVDMQDSKKSELEDKCAPKQIQSEEKEEDNGLRQRVSILKAKNKILWNKVNQFESGSKKPTALIRSHTFTRSPASQSPPDIDNDTSLEDISLKVMKSILTEKSELVQQYSQMVDLQLNDSIPRGSTLIMHNDIQRRITKLEMLNKEAVRQRVDLKNIITEAEKRRSNHKICSTCCGVSTLTNLIPTDGKKYTECDLSEGEALESLTKWGTPADSTSYHEIATNATSSAFSPDNHNLTRGSSHDIEEKNDFEDENENMLNQSSPKKVCPICGDSFPSDIDFKMFEKHVEHHFIGDEDLHSIDDTYEIITNVHSNFH